MSRGTVSTVTSSPAGSTLSPPSGTALARRLYVDPSLLEVEQELIFERTWQLAGHVCTLPRPGSYITAHAGTQPVLVVRDEDGGLRGLPQRLPPPRLAPAERLGPVQGGDPLPVPRLDLPPRRHADRRARRARIRRAPRQVLR